MARQFGDTWWGRAWIDALENRARLDPNRLPRGRTYARHGHVLSITIESGAIRAEVQGSRRHPYRVDIRFRTFDEAEWETVIDVIVTKAARAAALLDGDLDRGLVADAAAAGVDLLPQTGELQPRCSCPDWADPCKHSAAVCYLVAEELDADPFELLRLRGRGRDEILAMVRRRRSGPAGDSAGARPDGEVDRAAPDPGLRASTAWTRPLGGLPDVPHPRPEPGRVAVWPIDPPADAPFSGPGLVRVSTDAAARAWSAIRDGRPTGFDLDEDQDLARRAAAILGTDQLTELARRAGVGPRTLVRRAVAWEVVGPSGLDVMAEDPWPAEPLTMSAARDAVAAASQRRVRVDRNRLVVGDVQLRLARDGRWYRFAKRGGAWELDAGPADDPDDLVPG